VYLRILTR